MIDNAAPVSTTMASYLSSINNFTVIGAAFLPPIMNTSNSSELLALSFRLSLSILLVDATSRGWVSCLHLSWWDTHAQCDLSCSLAASPDYMYLSCHNCDKPIHYNGNSYIASWYLLPQRKHCECFVGLETFWMTPVGSFKAFESRSAASILYAISTFRKWKILSCCLAASECSHFEYLHTRNDLLMLLPGNRWIRI